MCVFYRLETVLLSVERFANHIKGDINELTQAIRQLIQEFNSCRQVTSGRQFHIHFTGMFQNRCMCHIKTTAGGFCNGSQILLLYDCLFEQFIKQFMFCEVL